MLAERIRGKALAVTIVVCFLWTGIASGVTNTYKFDPDQSTVIRSFLTSDTYTLIGAFQLTVDANSGSFDWVDAAFSDDPNLQTGDLGELFYMGELVGDVVNDTTIEFELPGGHPLRQSYDIDITLTLQNNQVILTGQRLPLMVGEPGFTLDAIANSFQILHVDAVNGDDLNDGLSPETAFATIQKGIDTAEDGDTVIVYPGKYTENINFLGKNIMLTSTSPTNPNIIDGTIIDGTVTFRGTEGPNCTLTGFNIDNYIVGFDRLIDPNGENHTHATISYCILENFRTHCDVSAILACDGIISNCLIANIYPGCLVPWRVAQIKGCHGLIKNCTIADIPDGIEVMEGGTCTIENSILYHRAWIFVNSGATLNISYCDLQGGLDGIEGDGTVNWGPGNIDTDPLFVRLGEDSDTQGDYHLLPFSPCIDAGDPGYVPGLNETDLDGNPRIVSGIVDMGAYEFQGMRTLYVDMDAPQFGDGTSWATAFRHLQDALFNATPGTEIKVAEGIYKPHLNTYSTAPPSREDTFQLKIGVVIKGGYAGLGQPNPNARDISLYETILSGDMNGDDEPNFVNNSDNSLHVVTGSGTDATAVLDGFTITAGNGENGAGMYNESGSPRVVDCTFVGNSAIHGGGAMRNRYSDPALTNCTFRENFSGTSGGGAMVNYYSYPTLLGCTFSENASAGDGGGMENNFDSSPTLIDCTFSGNTADGRGGGIGNSNVASAVLVNCRFLGNSAAWSGGGMASSRGVGTLLGCTFSGNSSDKHGGALSGTAAITNCTFSANSAEIGGGIYGGGELTNSILWGNRDLFGAGEEAQICGGTPVVAYTCIEGWTGALGGAGNFGDDPQFVEALGADNVAGTEDDNLRLLFASPCLDAGDNSALPPSLITDLDGNPRVVDGVVDMGAYEGPNQGFRLNTQAVTVAEGQAATFTVALAMDPLGTIEVTVAHRSGDSDITVVSGASLVFDSSNYAQPQTVMLAAAEDDDYFHGSAVISIRASGFVTAALGALESDKDAPTVLYVDDSVGGGDGTSWSDAFTDLQEALGVAEVLPEVEEIRLAQGVYTPAGPGADRTATFHLLNGVALRGGYAGYGHPNPDDRDVQAYETVLSGDLAGDDGPDFANNGENVFRVVTAIWTDQTAVLDGITVTGGNGYLDGNNYGYKGGGLYVESSSPTLVDCTFRGNLAMTGGGMYIESGNSTLTGCTFRGNMAFHDDAEYDPGGGGLYSSDSSLTISRCTFINNSVTASYHGGGDGGGAFFGSSDANLTDCAFIGNSVRHYGGAMTNWWEGNVTLVNCVFSGNRAGRESGGLDLYRSNSTLIQCTIVGNSAESTAGGIYLVQPAEATLSNCILWGNTVSDVADQWTQIYLDNGATAAVNYSCVQGWTGNLGGTGNIGENPLLVDADGADDVVGTEDDNLRLSFGSPCVDTGDPNYIAEPNKTDLDGNPRIIGGRVDMGAYEFWGPIYVDDDGPNDSGPGDPQVSDPLEDGTEAHPFDAIQEAINVAIDGYTVLVRQGSYFELGTSKCIDFLGKNITLTSADPADWDVVDNTIVRGYVQFSGPEGPNCKFTGFRISSIEGAIYGGNHTHATISHCNITGNGPCGATVIRNCDGIISNCLITDNTTFFRCGVFPVIFGCDGLIKNCTIANNESGLSVGTATIENCIIYNNRGSQLAVTNGNTADISYSNVQNGLAGVVVVGDSHVNWGPGNIDTDPCFVRLGYWIMDEMTLIEGDYHLGSEGWRWNTDSKSWTYDYITSRCIDAGNPGSPLRGELMSVPRDPENVWGINQRINMGAFGGTSQASMPPHDWALLADLNNDGTANFVDFAYQAQDWLITAPEQPGDLNRDGVLNTRDLARLANDWLKMTAWIE